VEAKMAYKSFYIPALRYSLSITSINQLDFEKIQAKATSTILAASPVTTEICLEQ
jgi:hypothetical protein